ncbi:uncharacterized protein Z518_06887 [Rhinocladiella mackenziei CBS 650.93]|uniref:Methyltransferase domain-containing protein n=1 Tax=Rhinocladiella mackenziei CBS 650.93 TaxID=1442369 RepID=A0A0D2J2X6_9EURO|nr:uncharacterized protein Z518_06887 [Rhinocladiella mackenziei CBS 650.93]KIX03335.1 hypothetical protein Z518_06887 [Rhinocladiella mackenziei CBS 650.93]
MPSTSTPIELYQATLKAVPSGISALLSSYSGIPEPEQKAHITTVRDRAYKSHHYPCLGRWRFLELDLAGHPLYEKEVLPALQDQNEKWIFLDLGTCLGQDVRKLAFDGADTSRLYGADLKPEFIEIGYELFRDEDRLPRDHFIAPADVFDFSPSSPLARTCDGKVGILHACSVFHLFELEKQKVMAQRCLRLLDAGRKRVLILGAQIGNVKGAEYPGPSGGRRFRHGEKTWKQMWEEIVKEGEWKEKIQNIEVGCIMKEHVFDMPEAEVNNTQRQIGHVEPGFRWMKFWVWIDFA